MIPRGESDLLGERKHLKDIDNLLRANKTTIHYGSGGKRIGTGLTITQEMGLLDVFR